MGGARGAIPGVVAGPLPLVRSGGIPSDRDGLDDRAEVTGSANQRFGGRASDPLDWDTDHGGISDGAEVKAGSDPTNVGSGPLHPRRVLDVTP